MEELIRKLENMEEMEEGPPLISAMPNLDRQKSTLTNNNEHIYEADPKRGNCPIL